MQLRHDIASLLPQISAADMPKFCAWYVKYEPHLTAISRDLYDRLPRDEQQRFLVWFLKRWAQIDIVNPVEAALYRSTVKRVHEQPREPLELNGKSYGVLDFSPQGFDFQLLCYDWVTSVDDVYYGQYEHGDVTLRPGDVIIDAGAFIGDTAILFHHKLAGQCQIHSFELLDENLQLLLHNAQRNSMTSDQITLNKLALTERTGEEIVIEPGFVQGATSIFGVNRDGERIQTVALDDYVVETELPRVDFIKMDIEGAEVMAINGARHTIQLFKPRMAICLYHKWDDMWQIPQAILATGVDYAFSFKWVEMTNGWEAILFAAPVSSESQPARTPRETNVGTRDHLADAMDALMRAYRKEEAALDSIAKRIGAAA